MIEVKNNYKEARRKNEWKNSAWNSIETIRLKEY
ncbi:MAG: hypothetical protein SCABRO_01748 [Candidatus Scalindua brodae]|uniref:Uncharacterized protein n=1 Tax=Candidatus Scalindua brodae TaxID=237368 RepID=A0A0B0EIU3_9BACT|nr:MAG: hypothetical protein SCABRO_01748 [Candidatus Scalindua brodae]